MNHPKNKKRSTKKKSVAKLLRKKKAQITFLKTTEKRFKLSIIF